MFRGGSSFLNGHKIYPTKINQSRKVRNQQAIESGTTQSAINTADVSLVRWKFEPCLKIACQRDEHAQHVSMKKKTLFARLQLKETRFISLRSKWLTYVLANDSTSQGVEFSACKIV